MEKLSKACCVFGHRNIEEKEKLKEDLDRVFESLITCENVDTFYVGSKSDFDALCREVLAHKKKKYPDIKRIYVRAEYPDIRDDYKKHLLENCDQTYFPERIRNAGRAVYVERNFEMIDKSDFCVVFFKDTYLPPKRKHSNKDLTEYQAKSGTGLAYKYAVQKNKTIINLVKEML